MSRKRDKTDEDSICSLSLSSATTSDLDTDLSDIGFFTPKKRKYRRKLYHGKEHSDNQGDRQESNADGSHYLRNDSGEY